MTAFALMSLIGLAVHLRAGQRWALWLHFAGLAAALFTKESALALIPLSFLYAVLWVGRSRDTRRRRILLGGYGALVLGWYILRRAALGGGGPGSSADQLLTTLIRNAPDLLVYVDKIALPLNLNVMPGLTATDAALGAASALLVGTLLVRYLEWPKLLFVFGWFMLFLVPALLLPGLPAYEHRLYFPLVGVMLGLSQCPIPTMVGDRRARAIAAIATIVTIQVVFAALTRVHAGVFRDRYTYWTNATRRTPHAGIARVNLGQIYESDGDPVRAAEQYRLALAHDPATPGANNNLGTLGARRGELDQAAAYFKREIELHPGNADAHYNLGLALKLSGRLDEAASSWHQTIAVNPSYAPAWQALADYYLEKGDAARARTYLEGLKSLEAR